ncbi:uncharacterized protein LOC111412647 [Olea europaea var. sylvestris]|uniref:uncharacterized protein LOC111412647 n=1 Tax=Olea europaea var. sylvestris TaxID=158386 RepID=UPI000C1D64F9|nr:uncharacterized protein LOC111412647 [Olea europaea var. sylvestris]
MSQVSNTKYISVVINKLDPQQKRQLEDSCIGHVARLPELKLSAQLIHEMVNRSVVCRKRFEAWFKVNQRFARFGLPEFALITGLKCSPVPKGAEVDKILEKTHLQDKMFANMDQITCSDLEKAFLKCANRNDRYKLGLALIIEGVFNSRDRNVGINSTTLSIVDDLDFFNAYPWGTVCFQLLIKSLLRGWGRKADMVKVNDCDRMTYTLYGFPLAVQIWTYEAIPELGARFSSKTCDDVPRMLRWSGMKQPHSRTYSDFFEKTNVGDLHT